MLAIRYLDIDIFLNRSYSSLIKSTSEKKEHLMNDFPIIIR